MGAGASTGLPAAAPIDAEAVAAEVAACLRNLVLNHESNKAGAPARGERGARGGGDGRPPPRLTPPSLSVCLP